MPRSNYENGFIDGVSIKNIPIEITQSYLSKVYWVDSKIGSNANKGTLKYPFASLFYAISVCKPNNGDIIFVAEGHLENVEETHLVDVSGITIIFLGNGSNSATLNFKNASLPASYSRIKVTANNVSFINPRFTSSYDNLLDAIWIEGYDCKIINASWYDGIGINSDNVLFVDQALRFVLDGWRFYDGDGLGTQKFAHIILTKADNAILRNINISGSFSAGNIVAENGTSSNIFLENISLENTYSSKPGILFDPDSLATNGLAKNVDIRIVTGTNFVSSFANMIFDDSCKGYNAAGYGINFV